MNSHTHTHTHTECNMRDSIILVVMFTSIKWCIIEKSLLFEIYTFGFAFSFIHFTTFAIESKTSRNTYYHTRYLWIYLLQCKLYYYFIFLLKLLNPSFTRRAQTKKQDKYIFWICEDLVKKQQCEIARLLFYISSFPYIVCNRVYVRMYTMNARNLTLQFRCCLNNYTDELN